MNRLSVLLLFLLGSSCACAAEGVSLPAAGQSSVESHQFDFLVGDWQLEVHPKVNSLAAMIHGSAHLLGSWKGWKAFDGLGVEDEMRVIDASGNPVALSHSMRIYSKTAARWNIDGLDVFRAHFSQATAHLKDGEMHIDGQGTDAEGTAYLSRTRYFNITADGFRMQQDRSVDNGQSWDEAVLTVDARRAASSAP